MADSPSPSAPTSLGARLIANVELVVVIFLGIVSVATAYTSFQSGLYHGDSDDFVSQSEAAATLAESLYLEGNQQYVQDAQTVLRLAELNIDAQSADPVTAADAASKYDEIYFIGVSEDLDIAIQDAAALDESEPDYYHYPLDEDTYLTARYSASYDEQTAYSDDLRAEGDALGASGDQLGFYTALMAITLFLLGVAAVVRNLPDAVDPHRSRHDDLHDDGDPDGNRPVRLDLATQVSIRRVAATQPPRRSAFIAAVRSASGTTPTAGTLPSFQRSQHALRQLLDGQREAEVVAPVAVDVDEPAPQTLVAEPELLDHPQARLVLGPDADLHAVQTRR